LVLLISPILGVVALVRRYETPLVLLLIVHSGLFVVIASVFATAPSVRYLQPVSICLLLIAAALWPTQADAAVVKPGS
jgi:hypothetical protein